LRPGTVADVTVIDPAAEWRVEASRLQSKSKNTPFLGWPMKGRAVFTMVGGRVVHEGAQR
jgi:dihydroorotase